MGIEIDLERDSLLGEVSRKRLRESYMKEEEQSPQERFATVAETFASNPAHAQRIYDYASKHWLSFSTPILSFGRSKKGLPISCFEVYMQDTAEGLVNTLSEVNWLSMLGGGVGIHVDIRSADDPENHRQGGSISHAVRGIAVVLCCGCRHCYRAE